MRDSKVELTNVVRVRGENRNFRISLGGASSLAPKQGKTKPRGDSTLKIGVEPWVPFRMKEFHPSSRQRESFNEKEFKGVQKVGSLASHIKIVKYDGENLVVQFLGAKEGLRTGYKITITNKNATIDLFVETFLNNSQLFLSKEIDLGEKSEFRWRTKRKRSNQSSNESSASSTSTITTATNSTEATSSANFFCSSPLNLSHFEFGTADLSYSYPHHDDVGIEHLFNNCDVLFIEQCPVTVCEQVDEPVLYSFTDDCAKAAHNVNGFSLNSCTLDVNGDEQYSHFETL